VFDYHAVLPFPSFFCSACTEACPVKIPLYALLIRHREQIVEKKHQTSRAEKVAMEGYAMWAANPAAYKLSSKMARMALKPWTKDEAIKKGPGPLTGWTESRDFPAPSKHTFRTWYTSRKKGIT